MNKELAIRRRILNIYNKREDDFPSLREYNDYLEEVEDLIFNLIEGVDVHAIEAKIAKYQEENAEQIIAGHARKAEEQAKALRGQHGHGNAAPPSELQAGQTGGGQYAPAVPAGAVFMQPRPTGPVAQPVHDGDGFGEDEEAKKLREERGARAGGWTTELGRKRAIEEAFSSLWVN